MSYHLINNIEAIRIKEILLNSQLTNLISIKQSRIELTIDLALRTGEEKVSFYNEGRLNVLQINNKGFELFCQVTDWGQRRINDVHIVLGTNRNMNKDIPGPYSERFSQIELSYCIKDDKYIYIVKNVSKFSGKGAIKRLFNNCKEKNEKEKRLQRLVDNFGGEVIQYGDDEWLCLINISLTDLFDDQKKEEIFQRFFERFLRFSLLIEFIIAVPEESNLTGGMVGAKYFPQLTAEQKKLIESKAMRYVRKYYETKGYEIEDVSGQRGLGYDYVGSNGNHCLFIEVKGTTMRDWTINFTAHEYRACEEKGKNFILAVVSFDDTRRMNVKRFEEFEDPINQFGLKITPSQYVIKRID